jgi:hypothetical protein
MPVTTLGKFTVVPGPQPTLAFTPFGTLGAQIVPYCIGDAQGNACSYVYVTVANTQSFAIASDDTYTTQQDRRCTICGCWRTTRSTRSPSRSAIC